MPDIADPAAPWLTGLIACATALEATAVRDALVHRGLTTRSVPSGRAKLAWTCVEGDTVLGIVASGHGTEAARQAAGFWMPRARTVISLGLAAGTGLVAPPAVIVAGDDGLRARARSLTGDDGDSPVVVDGRIATTATAVLSDPARASLAGAGFAAAAPEHEAWLDAAELVGGRALALALLADLAPLPPHLEPPQRPGSTGGEPLRRVATALRHPGARGSVRAHDRATRDALRPAALLAVAILVPSA